MKTLGYKTLETTVNMRSVAKILIDLSTEIMFLEDAEYSRFQNEHFKLISAQRAYKAFYVIWETYELESSIEAFSIAWDNFAEQLNKKNHKKLENKVKNYSKDIFLKIAPELINFGFINDSILMKKIALKELSEVF